ncbi:hypothetical protein CDZ98_15370 [Mameliella alba]|nr:hypothetical protein CDZ98_15370 [Mameliella alba]
MLNDTFLEIASWPIEAREESGSDYFFHFNDVSFIEKGIKNYVIGRKGTGKTAIADYLHSRRSYNKFSRLLSFKNFPFNALYSFADESYNRPNQYITIWTYVIYHYICSMMAENEKVLSRCKFDLKEAFQFEVKGALSQSVKNITSRNYGLTILGTGVNFAEETGEDQFDFIRANEALKGFIEEHIDDSDYFIIFDELDEDYRDILSPDRKDGYFELLISLFKAVQNIRAEFSGSHAKIRPVIFLRDDIFDLCRDVDKNKWLDRAVTLKWDESQLRQMTKYRLSQALYRTGSPVEPDEAWDAVFSVNKTRFGTSGKNSSDTFRFILGRTFLRPRDVVSYIRECAKIGMSLDGSRRISNQVIKGAIEGHSSYMRREIIDEVFPVMEDISETLDVLAKIRKQVFSRKEFNDRYREYQNQLPDQDRSKISESQVLKILYHFNVIGNVTSGGHRIFAYNSQVKVLNMDESLCVHGGLIRSLGIS